ncbi:MAG: HPr family phosphocarrier protein [Pseudomonadota bacterium]
MGSSTDAEDDAANTRTLLICNERGLHARASSKFVQLASTFDADVEVTRGDLTVEGTSIMDLMMLCALPGTEITIFTSGPDAAPALNALVDLVQDRFGEEK